MPWGRVGPLSPGLLPSFGRLWTTLATIPALYLSIPFPGFIFFMALANLCCYLIYLFLCVYLISPAGVCALR